MACDDSYTVQIIPLQNSLYSPDALHCFHWLKRRRDLERQKDVLWAGLQVVEQTQLWYQNRLQLNLQRHISFTGDMEGEGHCSCALRSCMQRVNGSMGSLMSDSCIWNNLAPEETGGSDWDLRWSNATLVKEVNRQNQRISMLELQKARLQQLLSYSTSDSSYPHIYNCNHKMVSTKSNREL
ncbi:suppressor APC domain-containing protein 1-like [Pimephales promelas]|uniref:suppressor APC domain-containing protein 1-like n=1 Tax=Pimephales promelas TaxID=90988 RepID=UPI001955E02E|nr:suppressor APC domain-containing protein 1-like [Pimephales promelas]